MSKNKLYISIYFLIGFVTILGLFLDIMAPDGALYASIAKTMSENNDFINLYSLGKDWLDKPHMPFWLSAFSFKLFGINNFAYKFPAVLIFFYGVWITYKFTKENYNKETAILASLILSTSLHSVISNFDVRAEPFLTAFIIASVYYFYQYINNRQLKHLIIGCLFAAFSLMTKGIFTLIPIIAALGGELIVKRNWKTLLSPIWLLAFTVVLIFTIPELYTLYQQFDLHPEKIVFGKNNVSGIKFFFWDSQFGRFFNTGPIVIGNGSVFFFLHTILWAFLPWGFLFYIATFLKIKRNLKKVNKQEEFYSIFAALAAIIVFSVSKFQLAHYTNIIFPFMAIITADFIYKLKSKYQKLQKTYTAIQLAISTIILILIPVIFYLMIESINPLFIIITIAAIFLIFQTIKNTQIDKVEKIFIICSTSLLIVYSFLMTSFYPTLLKYQGGTYAARHVNEKFKNINIFKNDQGDFAFELYNNKPLNRVDLKEISKYKGQNFYASSNQIELLKQQKIKFQLIETFNNFRITKLNIQFVNKNTRENVINKTYLITII
ncbi:4-amino-4-deoxy-L-arabinose transferase [Tenacibaculum sp. 190524A02b]|uniref:4-amino-4-deoxy-L-arabinose transferase n=1 Tax=Tenacibaculum vairaonense TaxID=3137860 RepID=A0ABP1FFB1_9FLAO